MQLTDLQVVIKPIKISWLEDHLLCFKVLYDASCTHKFTLDHVDFIADAELCFEILLVEVARLLNILVGRIVACLYHF